MSKEISREEFERLDTKINQNKDDGVS